MTGTQIRTKLIAVAIALAVITTTLLGVFPPLRINASANPTIITSNTITKIGDWDVEYWRDGGTGTMTYNGDGTFSAVWDVTPENNILFRAGRKFGTPAGVTQSHDEIGEIKLTFAAAHTISVNSLLCVYGWTARDTVEWYIFESWGTYAKGRASGQAQLVGTYTIPGEGTYEFYVSHERVGVPSIFSSNDTFPQYFAIRTAAEGRRTSGTVSVSEHFRQWEALGNGIDGALYEVAFCIEAWGSAGSGEVTQLRLEYGNNFICSVNGSGNLMEWKSSTAPTVKDGDTLILMDGARGGLNVPANATITITGTAITATDGIGIMPYLEAGATIIWEADYTFTNDIMGNPAVNIDGGGTFIMNSGKIKATHNSANGLQIANNIRAIITAGEIDSNNNPIRAMNNNIVAISTAATLNSDLPPLASSATAVIFRYDPDVEAIQSFRNGLTAVSAGTTVSWAINNGKSGVNFARSTNTGFIEIPCVTVQASAEAANLAELQAAIADGNKHIIINGGITITDDITLDGNGATLWSGTISGGEVFIIDDGGKLTLSNITLSGAGEVRGVSVVDGTFIMEDGTVIKNSSVSFGGGVLVGEDGTFIMNGGLITDNRASWGGGVYIADGGKFILNDGIIKGNEASWSGDNVWDDSAAADAFRTAIEDIAATNITLTQDIIWEGQLFIHNKTLNIDTNGFTLTILNADSAQSAVTILDGKLVMDDSGGGGINIFSYGGYGIDIYGNGSTAKVTKIIVYDGEYINIDGNEFKKGDGVACLDNPGFWVYSDGISSVLVKALPCEECGELETECICFCAGCNKITCVCPCACGVCDDCNPVTDCGDCGICEDCDDDKKDDDDDKKDDDDDKKDDDNDNNDDDNNDNNKGGNNNDNNNDGGTVYGGRFIDMGPGSPRPPNSGANPQPGDRWVEGSQPGGNLGGGGNSTPGHIDLGPGSPRPAGGGGGANPQPGERRFEIRVNRT